MWAWWPWQHWRLLHKGLVGSRGTMAFITCTRSRRGATAGLCGQRHPVELLMERSWCCLPMILNRRVRSIIRVATSRSTTVPHGIEGALGVGPRKSHGLRRVARGCAWVSEGLRVGLSVLKGTRGFWLCHSLVKYLYGDTWLVSKRGD